MENIQNFRAFFFVKNIYFIFMFHVLFLIFILHIYISFYTPIACQSKEASVLPISLVDSVTAKVEDGNMIHHTIHIFNLHRLCFYINLM